MSTIIIDLLYGLATTFVGAIATLLFCWIYFHRKMFGKAKAEVHHASEVLVRLQELASRVALDVDEHSNRVEEMNVKLTSADKHKPNVIVDVVAKLIQANQDMQKKLATTEDKLRKQAREIEVHATEARTDALTLLANRRAFDDELQRRVAEFRRLGRPFSLIMADVDHFKKFNDLHGHQAGDEVLQGVAKLLRRMMREMDIVARYGGEEFAVILPGTKLEDACKAALRAREAIDKCHFCHEVKGKLQLTVSFGVAEVLGGEEGIALVMRADKALYASKQGGRNCVHAHDGKTVHRVVSNKQPAADAASKQNNEKLADAASEIEDKTAKPVIQSEADLAAAYNISSRTNFCQQVRSRTAEWNRGGPTFSIILIEVNPSDQNSEDVDLSTREFAAISVIKFLTTTVREMDVVGHYAPGCFALLLPTASLADAIRAAERLREGFSQYYLSSQGKQPSLTLSIGVAQVLEMDDSITLLKRAESALDSAHRRSNNQTYYHDGKRCAPLTAMLETIDYLS
jgi:diguanylate cyclase